MSVVHLKQSDYDALVESFTDLATVLGADFNDREHRRKATRDAAKLRIKINNLLETVKPLDENDHRVEYHKQLQIMREHDGSVWEFKVADYSTVLVGRRSKDGFFVQRGDGSTYFYANYRVTALRKLSPFDETPANNWAGKGEPDPHSDLVDIERANLYMGYMTDDELANAVFLHGDTRPPIEEVMAGRAIMPIAYLTAAKERIRWLSRKLERARQPAAVNAVKSLFHIPADSGLSDNEVSEIRSAMEKIVRSTQLNTEMILSMPGEPPKRITIGTSWLKHLKSL